MEQYKVLILTDHAKHSSENSLYALAAAMHAHDSINGVDIASRANKKNAVFFRGEEEAPLFVCPINEGFIFTEDGYLLSSNLTKAVSTAYDLIWLRMPPPLSKSFLQYLEGYFQDGFIINNPMAIYETGSKAFLTNFASVCPPLQICNSLADIRTWKANFPIVLKPYRDYGGKGIVRIDGDKVWKENEEMNYKTFEESLHGEPINYLGVKFLKNVSKGDKRIVVVNGKIMGASLRLPAKDSWICNVSMGGSSNIADVDEDEKEIIKVIDSVLSKMGIVMYGVDTLVGDNGKRLLSEINTTSIGGLPQIAALQQKPLVKEAIDLILKYFLKHKQ